MHGIVNCDSVKKARKWLKDHGIEYRFHDFRTDGCDEEWVAQCCDAVGWEVLLNRRGTTWRKLPDDTRQSTDEKTVARLLSEQPTLIKRPVLTVNDHVEVGFDAERYRRLLLE